MANPKSFRDEYRRRILRLRVLPVEPGGAPQDPFSPEYLMVALQAKRLSLSRTVSAFSRQNVLFWPYLCISAFAKYLDLKIAVAIVEGLIVERKLLSALEPSNNFNSDEGRNRQT